MCHHLRCVWWVPLQLRCQPSHGLWCSLCCCFMFGTHHAQIQILWFCVLPQWKWQGIYTESTPGKCHAWSEYSAWGSWCHSPWPKTCRYRVIPFTVWDEEGQEYELCSLPALQTKKKAPELKTLPPTAAKMILHIIVWSSPDHVMEGCRSEGATCRGKRHH